MPGRRGACKVRGNPAPQQPVGDEQPDRDAGEACEPLVRMQQREQRNGREQETNRPAIAARSAKRACMLKVIPIVATRISSAAVIWLSPGSMTTPAG